MKKITLAFAGAAALALSTGALAGAPDYPAPSAYNGAGFYVTAGAGYGKTDLSVGSNSPLISASTHNTGFAFDAAAGYQFNHYVAAEAGYIYLPRIKININARNLGTIAQQKIHSGLVYLAVKGIYPITEQFDVFAKGGLGATFVSSSITAAGITTRSSDHHHTLVPVYGIGADYNINENVAVTAQGLATTSTGEFPATYIGTLGLTYKFV